jgi:hypothetical protein
MKPRPPTDEFDPADISRLPEILADGFALLPEEDRARVLAMHPYCGSYLAKLEGGWCRVWIGPVPASGNEDDYVLVGDFHISALSERMTPGSLN